jgi:Fe-S cluster biogenesis protein NfuA/nitrite reductase/ring-hydroxylating ferredoxin subunit
MTGTLPRPAALPMPTLRTGPPPPPPEPSFEQLAGNVDEALKAANALDGQPRKVVEAVREALEATHRAALVTIVRRLKADDAGRAALYELVDDPLIHMLFLLHGIIRADPMVEAQTALDTIRPGLQSHGGDVSLVRIEEGVAYVQLAGACNGCSMSSVTMRTTVEQALVAGVGVVESVVVVPSEPTPALITLGAVRRKDETPEQAIASGWVKTLPATDVGDGRVTELQLTTLGGMKVDVIIVRIGASMTAYRNECAHQGLPLGDAELDIVTGTLTCQWHGFCYEALTGDCTSAPGAALEQFPMRVDDGSVWVRVGT